MLTFDEFLTEKFAIKHKETGKIFSTHDTEADAKDEHAGLDNKAAYKVVKTAAKPKAFSTKE